MRVYSPVYSRSARILLAFLGAAAFAACGGDDNSITGPVDQTPVPAATVQATPAITFTPNQVTVTVGGTVTYDFGPLAHDVFFDNAPAGAPANIAAASTNTQVTLTFTTAGTYVYNCHLHPGMRGTVVVK